MGEEHHNYLPELSTESTIGMGSLGKSTVPITYMPQPRGALVVGRMGSDADVVTRRLRASKWEILHCDDEFAIFPSPEEKVSLPRKPHPTSDPSHSLKSAYHNPQPQPSHSCSPSASPSHSYSNSHSHSLTDTSPSPSPSTLAFALTLALALNPHIHACPHPHPRTHPHPRLL